MGSMPNVNPPGVPQNYVQISPGVYVHPSRLGGLLPTQPQQDTLPALDSGKEARPLSMDPSKYLSEVDSLSIVCRGIHLGEPMPKQRPRLSRGHVYTPESTKQHQASIAACVREQLPQCPSKTAAFGLRVVFYVKTHQRKDVDNCIKTVLDALNKIAFNDDSQIKELMGWSVLDAKNPRTEFVLYKIGEIDRETGICIRCGKSFRRYNSWRTRLYCSKECLSISQMNGKQLKCDGCGKMIVKIPSLIYDKNYCSLHCRAMSARTQLTCANCGQTFTRPQSLVKKGQKYCSSDCFNAHRVGKPCGLSQSQLSARAVKGWNTKRQSKASPCTSP